ncbi:hypothetical protein Tco_1241364 [Tanacetum coccineum]
MTHPYHNRRFVPQAVLTRSGKINSAGASVNNTVRPVITAGSKTTVNHPRPISNVYKKGYSQVTRPFNKYSANKNSIFNKKVNTVKVKDTTARDRAIGNPHQKEYKEKGRPIHLVADETVYKEWEDRMERAVTTASGLEVEQDSEAQTRFEAASKQSNDLPLSRVNTLGSGEDKRELVRINIDDGNAFCNEIEVNAGNSNLMLLALG